MRCIVTRHFINTELISLCFMTVTPASPTCLCAKSDVVYPSVSIISDSRSDYLYNRTGEDRVTPVGGRSVEGVSVERGEPAVSRAKKRVKGAARDRTPAVTTDVTPVINKWVEACFPQGSPSSERDLRELVLEAAEAARTDFDEKSAVDWAEGYEFPPSFLESDTGLLRAAGLDFPKMVERRFKILASDRLSADRVNRLRLDNPERVLMMDLTTGMRVFRPEGFTPNGSQLRTPLRSSYVNVAPAVNKMLGEVIKQKLAFTLPLDVALRHVPDLHFCKAHWTTKKGKPSGRPLGDMSNVDGTPLNTRETADAATDYYGQIIHPTIEDIAQMVHEFWTAAKAQNPDLRWEDLRIWKMDLKGAYMLLSFRPGDVGMFAMLLTGDVVYLQIAGIFGWSGTPAAFQVVTRAVSWELRHALRSRTLMYVDDIIGVCFEKDLHADLAEARRVCTDLLGSGAVADDKTEYGTRLDIIGYTMCLTTERVLIARKNFLTALHGFISTDTSKRMNLRTAQRLASWGTRYGKICRVMRPFCTALNRATWGRTDPYALFDIPAEALIAIQCWRAMLCLVRYKEAEYTRTIVSFATTTPVVVAEFDASLSGAGLLWFMRSDGAEVAVGVSAVDLSFLSFGTDSSFQNLAEFIGAILAVLGQIMLGLSGRSLALRGDSVTALTWAITERPRGAIVTNASIVWTLLCIAAEIDAREVIHIPGEDNVNCDRLSRRGTEPVTSVAQEAVDMGYEGLKIIEMNGCQAVMDILELCDPRTMLSTESDFISFWIRARSAIGCFVEAFPLPHTPHTYLSQSSRGPISTDPHIHTSSPVPMQREN